MNANVQRDGEIVKVNTATLQIIAFYLLGCFFVLMGIRNVYKASTTPLTSIIYEQLAFTYFMGGLLAFAISFVLRYTNKRLQLINKRVAALEAKAEKHP